MQGLKWFLCGLCLAALLPRALWADAAALTTNPIGMAFVGIPAGSVRMGTNEE